MGNRKTGTEMRKVNRKDLVDLLNLLFLSIEPKKHNTEDGLYASIIFVDIQLDMLPTFSQQNIPYFAT